MSVNSGRAAVVVQKGSSNKGSSNSDHEQCHQTVTMNSGRQTVVVNSGRPIGVVQEGSSNSDHE